MHVATVSLVFCIKKTSLDDIGSRHRYKIFLVKCSSGRLKKFSRSFTEQIKLEFHGTSFPRSILVTSSRGCPQQVVRVVRVDFGERHRLTDIRAALHPADRRPTNQVSAWQDGRGSRRTRPHARLVTDILARMSRGCYTRKTVAWNLSYTACTRRHAAANLPFAISPSDFVPDLGEY